MEASGAIIPSICSSMTRSIHHAGFSENPLSLPSRIFSLVYFNQSNYVNLKRNSGSNGVARNFGVWGKQCLVYIVPLGWERGYKHVGGVN